MRGADLPFTITDYHVHLSDQLPIEAAVALAAERGQRFGILEHPGSAYSSFGLDTDAELRHYAAQLRRFPVHVGLQPMFVGWAGQFSTEALSELDYVLMDADTTDILTNEPLQIFARPTYLPINFARHYDEIWTPGPMSMIIDLAKARDIAPFPRAGGSPPLARR